MTKLEAHVWAKSLAWVYCGGDLEGEAFMNEWVHLLMEFITGEPIQRKPY